MSKLIAKSELRGRVVLESFGARVVHMSVWGWVALFYIVEGWVNRIAPPTPYTTPPPGTFNIRVAAFFDGPKRSPPNFIIVALGAGTILFVAWITGNLI